MKELLIAADHAGFETKEYIKQQLVKDGYTFKDFGTFSTESMDYPDVVHPLATLINQGEYPMGIVICGSGNGVNMTANKYPNVRSALCWNTELAALARQHNNANVLALPARFIDKELALNIAKTFLTSSFEGGRHERRVNKIAPKL
ncbi:MAG: ribose 5-phosphate isomerase B [Bacteroidales bacterium]|jgi:ribose 5-phosphate isomerase B|nr:ribose 5-phosphate isomerase B [Bacteroidales bacterium]MBO7346410.1 ribose 5-phosphate isomerase B [Bacteroidales bacterium]MBQ4478337.1 ribose 5-phosphate isomerase B [Bacteroidales bacterium]MBR4452880.1 ribose 5-phosphate isomerase B [Bacteroidales bacterium]